MKKIIIVLLFITFLFPQTISVSAEDSGYKVVSIEGAEKEVLYTFNDFLDAKEYFHVEKENYSNLGVYQDEKLLMIKNGLALIPNNDCTVNFEYRHASDNFKGYTNGCYAVDSLYLDTNDTGTRFLFELAGVQAWGSADLMELIPIEEVAQLTSYYVKEGSLYHQIKTNMNSSSYGNSLNLGPAPDYLTTDQIYVSYNGHYFYPLEDFEVMVEDLRNGTYRQAINALNPYYNYYLMLPHRSQSNHTATAIATYFQEVMGYQNVISHYVDEDRNSINDYLTQSQYYGFESSFFAYQGVFGSNAMMMLALSMNETASGKSSLAFTRNNLFGHAAYDSDVENNAERYLTISASVYSHAKNYISARYSNPEKFQYHGSHFGDKASGMNVAYASDPYWSEKAVQYYITLDKYFGYLDYNDLAIGIKTSNKEITIYAEDLTTELYQTSTDQNLPFILLEDTGTHYKVQLDPPIFYLDQEVEYSYDYKKNVGYIEKSAISVILNEQQIRESEYLTVIYSSGTGTFKNGLTRMSTQVKNHQNPIFEEPIQEGYLFKEWQVVSETDTTIVYEASYHKIEKIEIVQLPPTVIEMDNRISLKGGMLSVKLEGADEFEVPITSSMVSNYSIKEAGVYDVVVQYGGVTTIYQMEVSAEMDATRIYLNETTAHLVEQYDAGILANEEELESLKELMTEQFYPRLTIAAVHKLDVMYQEYYSDLFSVIIHKNTVNLSVSGLYLSTDYSLKKQWIKDTIEIKMSDSIDSSEKEILEKIALANGYTIEYYFGLEFLKNGKSLENNGPLVFTVDTLNEGNTKNYQVLQVIDGEVIALQSFTYTSTMKFKCFEEGSFVLVSKETNNVYDSLDYSGNNTVATNGFNYHQLVTVAPWVIGAFGIIVVVGVVLRKKKK